MRSFNNCRVFVAAFPICMATASVSTAQTVFVESYRFYTRGTASAEASASCVPPGSVTTECAPETYLAFEYLQMDPHSAGWWDAAFAQCGSRCDACETGGAGASADVSSENPRDALIALDSAEWNWRGEFWIDADAFATGDANDACSPGQSRAAGEGETELEIVLIVHERTGLTVVWDLFAGTNGQGDHAAAANWEVAGPGGAMIAIEFNRDSGVESRFGIEEFVLEPGRYGLKYKAQVYATATAGQRLEAASRLGLELRFEKYKCPEIYQQPRGFKSCLAAPVLLAPWIFVGTFPEYQWRKDGVPLADGPTPHGSLIEGTREGGLRISHTGPADSGSYDCVVSNLCGSVVTEPARVEIASCFGDLNCSGSIGVDDLALLLANFGTHPPDGFERGDLNEDGTVNLGDISILMNEFGRDCD